MVGNTADAILPAIVVVRRGLSRVRCAIGYKLGRAFHGETPILRLLAQCALLDLTVYPRH